MAVRGGSYQRAIVILVECVWVHTGGEKELNRDGVAFGCLVDERIPAVLFRVDVRGSRHSLNNVGDAPRKLFERLQVVAEDLDANLRASIALASQPSKGP